MRNAITLKLAFLFLGVTAALAALATRGPSPWIIPDELLYSELAKSIAGGHLPAIRGATSFSYGVVYPTLISPAWLFTNPATAYTLARVINAVLIASAILPAFFLARRFVSPRSALIVAALCGLMPSTLYAGMFLVENALYPAFLLAVLLIVRAVESPTRGRQLAVFAGVALAFGVKSLAVALVPSYFGVILVFALLERRAGSVRAAIRAYRQSFLLVGAVGGLAIVAGSVTSGNPLGFMGKYGATASHVDVLALPQWFAYHIAELDVYVAVVPLVATVLLATLVIGGLTKVREARLFVAVALPVIVCTTLAVSAYSSTPNAGFAGYLTGGPRLHERNLFYLVPLFLIGLAVWVELNPVRPRRWAIVVALLAGALPAILPVGRFQPNANFQALALVPWYELGLPSLLWPFLAGGAGIALARTLIAVRARSLRETLAVTTVWFLFVAGGVYGSTISSAHQARSAGAGPDVRWIDHAVGAQSRVAVLWSEPAGRDYAAPRLDQRIVWINEFFNRSVGNVYALGARMPYGLPDQRVRLRAGTVIRDGGVPLRAEFVLARCALGVVGSAVAVDSHTGTALYRTGATVRLDPARAAGCPPTVSG